MGQESHRSDPPILNRRTLQRDHRHLAKLLRPGMDILDVGCGTGAITADIARAVGPDGIACGIDRDDANVAGAIRKYGQIGNLRFEHLDILALGDSFNYRFDIVTAARTVQWISEPRRAIRNMKNAAKREGQVIVLDYNLDDTRWEPEPPVSFLRLYRAFLDWRSANNWDNRMASNLAALFHSEGLIEVTEHPSDEVVQRAIPIFWTLTHLEFGSTSLRMLDQIWLKQAFLKKVPDVVPKKITGSMFAKRCACKHIRC